MNKYRLANLLVGLILMLQPILVVLILKSEANYFISGVGTGVGTSLIIISECIIPLCSKRCKEVKE